VRALRDEKGISQEELAALSGLHRNYVGSVERGERDIGILSLATIAGALGLSLADFCAPFQQIARPRRY